MIYTGYELLWLFFIYAFLGWVLETSAAAVRHRRFVNRGLVNAPFCVIYGVDAVLITVTCQELNLFWLFLYAVILSTVLEWSAGHLIERMYHERWWDYSGRHGNLDGYICLSASALWGILSIIMMRWGNPLLLSLFRLIPLTGGVIITLALLILLAVDTAATLIVLHGHSRKMQRWKDIDTWFARISARFSSYIYSFVSARIEDAYSRTTVCEEPEVLSGVFAYGCSFYKLVWLFLAGSFLGDITETIFCRITAGEWMSRSSVVWGPFSIVWGFAVAAATALLYRYRNASDSFLFITGTFLGGAYEYFCSVCTEIMFGKVFWDYSNIPFNLGGRINLLYCFFWGIAAVVWMKVLYPRIAALIERLPVKAGTICTWIFIVFMCLNMAVSCMALVRGSQRSQGVEATQDWQKIMDGRFDDARLRRIYPNALDTE